MNSKGATCNRLDGDIFAHFLTGDSGAKNLELRTKEERQFTWPQIRYWIVGIILVIGGASGAIWGDDLSFTWAQRIAKELGPGVFTAGILALLVEPFFRKEFARDAFLAAFRYVLPEEFKEEVTKILAHPFVSKDHIWKVKIERTNNESITLVTNRTSSDHDRGALYTIIEYNYEDGPAEICECSIEKEGIRSKRLKRERHADWIEAITEKVRIAPGETAKLSMKAKQYRRSNDSVWETFIDPIVNPVIEVAIDDYFDHKIEFGTKGDYEKSKFDNRYTLNAVYFPGQYMHVRWWPKKGHPELPGSGDVDSVQSQ